MAVALRFSKLKEQIYETDGNNLFGKEEGFALREFCCADQTPRPPGGARQGAA